MLNELRNRNTLLIAIAALVVGVLFGWWVLGWGLFPVEYKDGNPTGLAQRYKEQWVQMVADSYAIDQDANAARQRLLGFSNKELTETMTRLKNTAQANRQDGQAARIQRLADGLSIALAPAGTPAPSGTTAPAPATGSGLPTGLILGLLGLLLIVGGLIGIVYFFFTRRQAPVDAPPVPLRARDRVNPPAPQAPMTVEREGAASLPLTPELEEESVEAPLGRFVTTYKLGDDGYDTSFSIETPNGEFLGECGVGISDVVGDSPQKVTAFEVWLFDKNDIKTVTKVLMSDFAYNNENIRKKLLARGDAVLAQKGRDIVLETESLRVVAIVSDMAYGSGGSPQSFFSKLTIELAPTIKNTVPA